MEKIDKGDDMKAKIMLIVFLASCLFFSSTQATNFSNIEVFDLKKEQVIEIIANSEIIQGEIKKCLKTNTGITKRFNPIPKEGKIIKIPVEPSVTLNNQWINTLVDEVKLILPTDETPLLMIFDDENKPYFLEFEHDITKLLSEIESRFLSTRLGWEFFTKRITETSF